MTEEQEIQYQEIMSASEEMLKQAYLNWIDDVPAYIASLIKAVAELKGFDTSTW